MPRTCGAPVQGYFRQDIEHPEQMKWQEIPTAFTCSVKIADGEDRHSGPHACVENAATMNARAKWNRENGNGENSFQPQVTRRAYENPQLRQQSNYQPNPAFSGRTFTEYAEPGTTVPHPDATEPCPIQACPDQVRNRDRNNHLVNVHGVNPNAVPQSRFTPQAPAAQPNFAPSTIVQQAKERGNPYMNPGDAGGQAAPPAEWIVPVPGVTDHWVVNPNQGRPTQSPDEVFTNLPKQQSDAWAVEHNPTAPPKAVSLFDDVHAPVIPTKTREGDQPLPTINTHEAVQDVVIREIEERKALGIQRYGSLLQPDNGRDALKDASEEALDLLMYLTQYRQERAIYLEKFEKLIKSEFDKVLLQPETLELIRDFRQWLSDGR